MAAATQPVPSSAPPSDVFPTPKTLATVGDIEILDPEGKKFHSKLSIKGVKMF